MKINRRECVGWLGVALAGAGLGVLPRSAMARRVPLTYFGWTPLDRGPTTRKDVTGGTWSRLNVIKGDGTNSLLVAMDGAFVLVDTKSAPLGAMLRQHFGYFHGNASPPGLVINTHYHRDTTGGNEAFKGLVDIVAHPAAIRRIGNQHVSYQIAAEEYFRNAESFDKIRRGFVDSSLEKTKAGFKAWTPESFKPTRAMEPATSGAMEAISVGTGAGKIELELYHFGPGHTDGDIVVRFPKYNVMHVGDLCFNRCHAFIDRGASSSTGAWTNVLGKVIDLCNKDTIIVPGNGEVTDVQGLKDQITYFDVVREAVKKLVDAKEQRSAAERLEIERFKEYGLPQVRAVCFGAVYDELTRDGGGK